MEVSRFVEHETVAVTEDVGREPTAQAEATSAEDWRETALNECLASLEVLTCNRQLGFFCEFPHSRDVNCSVRSTHDERSTFLKSSVSIAHRRSDVLAVVSLHSGFQVGQMIVDLFVNWNVDFG